MISTHNIILWGLIEFVRSRFSIILVFVLIYELTDGFKQNVFKNL